MSIKIRPRKSASVLEMKVGLMERGHLRSLMTSFAKDHLVSSGASSHVNVVLLLNDFDVA